MMWTSKETFSDVLSTLQVSLPELLHSCSYGERGGILSYCVAGLDRSGMKSFLKMSSQPSSRYSSLVSLRGQKKFEPRPDWSFLGDNINWKFSDKHPHPFPSSRTSCLPNRKSGCLERTFLRPLITLNHQRKHK